MAKYTRVVYLPYFAAITMNEISSAFTSFFKLNTQKYSWRIACQSEPMKRLYEHNASFFPERKNNLVGCIGWHGDAENLGFNKRWFTELTDIEFEGHKFMAPKDWDGFLKHSFVEKYMTPPPKEKQVGSLTLSEFCF